MKRPGLDHLLVLPLFAEYGRYEEHVGVLLYPVLHRGHGPHVGSPLVGVHGVEEGYVVVHSGLERVGHGVGVWL